MARRGRTAGFSMGPEHRDKIAKSNIVNRFIKASLGEITVDSVQAGLLIAAVRKIVPDLAAVEHTGEVQQTYVAMMPSSVADLQEWRRLHMTDNTIDNAKLIEDQSLTEH